jgi:NAD(P)-dependent dehydrogenase (short-subunit alcohol dehydrogenase family)
MEQNFLAGKTALVTGAGSGIGRAIAVKLAGLGAAVTVTDLDPAAAAETLALLNPGDHQAVGLDVTDRENVGAVLAGVREKYGRLDILANNAGVSTMQHLEFLTEKEWDFNLNVNLKGVFHCTTAAIPYLKETKGRIVNTASMAATKPAPILLAHYTASKYGVLGFTKSCALELAKYGITVNCVCPGYVKTSMQEREVEIGRAHV